MKDWEKVIREREIQRNLLHKRIKRHDINSYHTIKRKLDVDDSLIAGEKKICPGIGKMCIEINFCIS